MAYENLNKELENGVDFLIRFIGKTIKNTVLGIFRGIKKLNTFPKVGVFLLTFLVSAGAWFLKDKIYELPAPIYIHYLLYYVLLAFPILYLLCMGAGQNKKQVEYEQIFKDIDFIGKDKKYPILCGSRKEGKKVVYVFKSNIPLPEWKAAKARLETGLNLSILKLESGSNKKIVQMTTLPSDYKIPEMIKWSDEYCSGQNGIITIGQGALGSISFDLNRTPHALIAGETGSGKSVILRCILFQTILQSCKVFMIDFKGGVEFGKQYEKYGEVITERERALEVLNLLVEENEYRLKIFRDLEVKNLHEYNKKTGQNLCRIGVFCDEVAEMLDKKGVSKENKKIYEEIEGKVSTLARLSRATGINLFLGVQRPDANVLTGQIKNNVPIRISGRFADKTASEIVLGNTDAVELPDIKGRFLYKVGNETIEFQSYYFDDETMLHEVDEEIGNMLLEAPSYKSTPNKTTNIIKQESKEMIQKVRKKETKVQASPSNDFVIPKLTGAEKREQKKIEEALQKMNEEDLNLNFWSDEEGK